MSGGAEAGGPVFPPLLTGLAVLGADDMLAQAVRAAREGADGGTVLYSPEPHPWRVGIVLAPEAPLAEALTVTYALEMAIVDAIGALVPPEVGITWAWPDIMLANGAVAGRLRAASPVADPAETPDWLAFAFSVDLAPLGEAPGETPNRTTLAEEGAFDLDSLALTEVWARHALLWLSRWMEGGLTAVAPHWTDRAYGAKDEERETLLRFGRLRGRYLGLDDEGALLFRKEAEGGAGGVEALALTSILARSAQDDPPRLSPAPGGGEGGQGKGRQGRKGA